MSATTIRVIEGTPAAYPSLDPMLAIEPSVVWARLEGWIAYRWGPREVAFTVSPEGRNAECWRPPLYPFTLETAELWQDGAWQEFTPPASPTGYTIRGAEFFRFAGMVGAETPPPDEVMEAARRLQRFWAAAAEGDPIDLTGGATSRTEGDLTLNTTRPAGWLAKAIHSSGAADLLRKYRRAP